MKAEIPEMALGLGSTGRSYVVRTDVILGQMGTVLIDWEAGVLKVEINDPKPFLCYLNTLYAREWVVETTDHEVDEWIIVSDHLVPNGKVFLMHTTRPHFMYYVKPTGETRRWWLCTNPEPSDNWKDNASRAYDYICKTFLKLESEYALRRDWEKMLSH